MNMRSPKNTALDTSRDAHTKGGVSSKKKTWNFPEHGVTVEAETYEEALQKLEEVKQ